MSRSNPTVLEANPAVRWFEWNGEKGTLRYYDKAEKKSVDLEADFTFILLDELGSVGGFHKRSQSGIYSNEVRDTRQDVLVVKAFKAGTLAEGLYTKVKDRITAVGGQFVSNCYVAFRNPDAGGELTIGSIRFKGAALGTWMEFRKAHRGELFEKAIRLRGYTEKTEGKITFRVPCFQMMLLSQASNDVALELDRRLQKYLTSYLQRTTSDQIAHVAEQTGDEPALGGPVFEEPSHSASAITDDDIPF